jgi:hypothetical protein
MLAEQREQPGRADLDIELPARQDRGTERRQVPAEGTLRVVVDADVHGEALAFGKEQWHENSSVLVEVRADSFECSAAATQELSSNRATRSIVHR